MSQDDMTVKVKIQGDSKSAVKATDDATQAVNRLRDAKGRFVGAGKSAATTLDAVGSAAGKAGSGMGAAAGATSGMTGSFIKAQVVIEALRRSLDLVIGSVSKFTSTGISYNAAMESAELGIASLIATQGKFITAQGQELKGMDALNAARRVATEQMQQLKVAGLETTATTQELVVAFQQGLAPGLAAGLDVDQVRRFTVAMTQAAGALGLPMNQLAEEVRDLLGANINPRNTRIATALSITNEQIRNLRAQSPDELFAFLDDKLKIFQVAGVETAKTWGGLTSNVQEVAEVFSGMGTQPLFEKVKAGLQDAFKGVFDTKNARVSDTFQGLLEAGQTVFSALGDLAQGAMSGLMDNLKSASEWLSQNKETVDEIVVAATELARQVGGLLVDVVGIATGTVKTKAETGELVTIVRALAVVFGVIRDLITLIWTGVKSVGAIIFSVMLYPISQFLDALAKAANFIGKTDWAKDLSTLSGAIKNGLGKAWDSVGESAEKAMEVLKGNGATAQALDGLTGKVRGLNAEAKKSGLQGVKLTSKPVAPGPTTKKDQISTDEHQARLAEWEAESMERRTLAQEEAAALKKIEADLQKDLAKLKEESKAGKFSDPTMYTEEVKGRTAKAEADKLRVTQDYSDKRLQLEDQLNNKIESADGDSLGRRLAAIRKSFAAIRQEAVDLGKDASLAGSIDDAESRALVRAKSDALLNDFQYLQSGLQADEQGITNLQDAGLITTLEARKREADAIAAQLAAMQPVIQAMQAQADAAQAKAAQTGNESDANMARELTLRAQEATNAVQVLNTSLQTCRNAWGSVQAAGASALSSGLVDTLASASEGFDEMGDAAMNMARSVARAIQEAIVKMMLMKAAQAALGAAAAANGAGSWQAIALKAFSFSEGGYTGPGGKYEPAGIVHRGEYVHDQETVNYWGTDFLESLHPRRLQGFASGGQVGPPSAGELSSSLSANLGISLDRGLILEVLRSDEAMRIHAKHVAASPKLFNHALGRG